MTTKTKTTKRYRVAKDLDVAVDYFVTKASNMIVDHWRLDKPVPQLMQLRFDLLTELQVDLFWERDGVFTVSSNNYLLACKCRDEYRARH